MTIYQSTPDYYNDYISHGWAKDASAKVHKYIERWRGKNGKWYYRYKSKVQEGLAKIARRRWKTADGKSLSPETITRNARKPGLQLSKKDYGKAGYNPWSSGLRPTGKTYRLNKRNLDAGTQAGRKRVSDKKNRNLTTRGYSDSKKSQNSITRNSGNLTSRGYSGSQGSGESKRQRNLGTRRGRRTSDKEYYWLSQEVHGNARRQDANFLRITGGSSIPKKNKAPKKFQKRMAKRSANRARLQSKWNGKWYYSNPKKSATWNR